MALAIGSIVLDCPEPTELAEFYAALLGWSVDGDTGGDWVDVVDPAGGPSLAFQGAAGYVPPTWPDGERPQMFHLDVTVADMDVEHERVVGLGAKPLTERQGSFRVYADPAGHPFCLCLNA